MCQDKLQIFLAPCHGNAMLLLITGSELHEVTLTNDAASQPEACAQLTIIICRHYLHKNHDEFMHLYLT